MSIEWVRHFCLSLPHVTEHIQWEDDLVFKIGGKMFAVARLDVGEPCMSFKSDAEGFASLVEIPGIMPAPYLARAQWVALESFAVLPRAELERLLQCAHELVFANLPKRIQLEMARSSNPPRTKRPIERPAKPSAKSRTKRKSVKAPVKLKSKSKRSGTAKPMERSGDPGKAKRAVGKSTAKKKDSR